MQTIHELRCRKPGGAGRARWGLLLAVLLAPSLGQASKTKCEQLDIPVTLAAGDPTVYHVASWLCSPSTIHGRTIQVLVPGFSYDHRYWDPGFSPEIYSYVKYANDAGYATLNLDRIGIGQSDHPPADQVTVAANAYVVHQVVQALRSGNLVVHSLGRVRAETVMLVGHSLGSVVSAQEAASYHDVDGVILTGFSHTIGPYINDLFASIVPVQLDPVLAPLNLPAGYLTTAVGTRAGAFFYAPSTDPAVLAWDEANKATGTTGELTDFGPAIFSTPGITAPVLEAIGDKDLTFCAAPSCSESHTLDGEDVYFAPEAQLEKVILPDAGHDLTLQLNAPAFFAAAIAWSDAHVGSGR